MGSSDSYAGMLNFLWWNISRLETDTAPCHYFSKTFKTSTFLPFVCQITKVCFCVIVKMPGCHNVGLINCFYKIPELCKGGYFIEMKTEKLHIFQTDNLILGVEMGKSVIAWKVFAE